MKGSQQHEIRLKLIKKAVQKEHSPIRYRLLGFCKDF